MGFELLKPFYCSGRNRLFPRDKSNWKGIALGLFCLLICVFIYFATHKVVAYFHKQSELGIILSLKIFQMGWITLFAMLVFSCMVSVVSAVFLSKDNEIVFAAPVSPEKLYFMRFTSIFFYTSWMMILFSIPVFAAFGVVFEAAPLFWPLMVFAVISTALTSVGFGTGITVILVNLFPARRTKDIVFYLSLCFAVLIYTIFRLMRPEDLANPEKFAQFVDYLSSISGPAGPYVPGGWAADFLVRYLMDREIDWLLAGLLIFTPASLYIIGEWLMRWLFFTGFSKAQESFGGYRRFGSRRYLASPTGWMIKKEAKTFLRDSAEWSQLFMVGALVVVYLYNFKVLPLERSFWREEYMANLISFMNIGLTGFVITSLSARFAFPAIGSEGGAFFIIRSSPLSTSRFLFQKYLFYVIPFTLLSFVLVVVSDYFLKIEGPIWWISIITSTVLTWIIVALALGFGAIYANFKAENKASAIGSVGGVLFMLTCFTLEGGILALGAWPAFHITRKWLRGGSLLLQDYLGLAAWGIFSLGLSILLVMFFLQKGIRKINEKF